MSGEVLNTTGMSLRYPQVDNLSRDGRNRTDPTPHYNGTGYYVENDEVDNSFSDIQTLFLACFATLVPLVFSLLTAFAVRILWRKYRRNRDCRSYDGVLHQEESSDHVSGQSSGAPLHAHLLNSDKVKPCESQFSITADEIECSGSPVLYSGSSSRTNHASANGSIITMTLKNNHLIVETEERNDIVEDSRETTMKYSPSAQDGVFVVEVQQGVRRDGAPGYAPPSEDADQRALVHNPPERFNDEDKLEEVDEEYYPETTSPKTSPRTLKSSQTNTGLSQSALSPPHPYTYTLQSGYGAGPHGYPLYTGYPLDEPPPRPSHRPKVTAAVYKQNGRLMSMASLDPDAGLCCDKRLREQMELQRDDEIQPLSPPHPYTYTLQSGYGSGPHGYPLYTGYPLDEPPPRPSHRPKVTAAVYKQNGRLMSMASLDPDAGLCCDKRLREQMELQRDDEIQREQQRLGHMREEK